MDFIKKLYLPPPCKYVMEATDAGPGVGVSNVEMKYKDLEMARIDGWTHLNRIHRAPHDSARNKAERSNAALGETLVDGEVVQWESTDGLNHEQIKQLSVWRFKEASGRYNATY